MFIYVQQIMEFKTKQKLYGFMTEYINECYDRCGYDS